MKTTTYQNRYEAVAHAQRRQFIDQGSSVSLIAYNPECDSYDFDVYTEQGEPWGDGTGFTGTPVNE